MPQPQHTKPAPLDHAALFGDVACVVAAGGLDGFAREVAAEACSREHVEAVDAAYDTFENQMELRIDLIAAAILEVLR